MGIEYKFVHSRMGRIGKCKNKGCGGELIVGEICNDVALNYVCKKCLTRIEAK